MKKVITVCVAVTDGVGLLRIFGGVSDVKYHVGGVDETPDVVLRLIPTTDSTLPKLHSVMTGNRRH